MNQQWNLKQHSFSKSSESVTLIHVENEPCQKTDIIADEEIKERLFDPIKSFLNMIETIMKSKDRLLIQGIVPNLIELFEQSFSNDPFGKTHLSFALYRLLILQANGFELDTARVIKIIRENFVLKPHHTGLFCRFLSMFADDENIGKFLLSFLKSEDNIYEWQELKVQQTLLKFNIGISRSDVDFFINSASDRNKHYAVRAFYFLLVGKYGNNRDRELITDCYKHFSEAYTKMAIILAVQELGKNSRNSFYSRVKSQSNDEEIDEFIDYVKSLSSPIYYLVTELPKIETYDKFEEPSYEPV